MEVTTQPGPAVHGTFGLSDRWLPGRVWLWGLAFLALAVGILDAVLLDQIPWAATVDDGAYAAADYQFIRSGRAGVPMAQGLFGQEQDLVHHGRIPAAVVGVSEALLGPSSRSARLPSLLVVGLSVLLVFLIARRSGLPPATAWAASLLWFLTPAARLLIHSSRPDVFLLLLTLLGVLLLLKALDHGEWWRFFVAGLAAGATVEAQMIGAAVILTTAAGALLLSDRATRWRRAVWLCAGAAPVLLAWVWIHIASQPELWRLQWSWLWDYQQPVSLMAGGSAVLRSTFLRYRSWFWDARYHRYLLELPFIIGALLAGWRLGPGPRRLVLLFGVFHAALALFCSLPHAGYTAAVFPFICVLLAGVCWRSDRLLPPAAGACLLVFYLAQTGYWALHPEVPLPTAMREDVLRHVGPQPFLAGDNLWFYFYRDGNARTALAVTYAQFLDKKLSWPVNFSRYVREQGIRFYVADKVMKTYVSPEEAALLQSQTTLEASYDYGRGRRIDIYRFLPE